MDNMITLENFSPDNRSREIGNSLYKICNVDSQNGKGKWYLHEEYNHDNTLAGNNAFFDDDLQVVINTINGFTKEKEIVALLFGN